jgi:hypothetical protein
MKVEDFSRLHPHCVQFCARVKYYINYRSKFQRSSELIPDNSKRRSAPNCYVPQTEVPYHTALTSLDNRRTVNPFYLAICTSRFVPHFIFTTDDRSFKKCSMNLRWERRPVSRDDNITTFMCRFSWNSGSPILQEPSKLVYDCNVTSLINLHYERHGTQGHRKITYLVPIVLNVLAKSGVYAKFWVGRGNK